MFATGTVSMPAAFIAAAAFAFAQRRRGEDTIGIFTRGMGHADVMAMCLVFILAGAFAATAKAAGAVEAMVQLSRIILPDGFQLAGVFAVSCVVSLAMGTSCGTISAIGPIAFQLACETGVSPGAMAGAVVGGAMFGDNLSVISDTTIAATRTQGVKMRDKFLANVSFALPAAAATLAIYIAMGFSQPASAAAQPAAFQLSQAMLVLPYFFVLAAALCGMDVMAILLSGTVLSAAAGVSAGTLDFASTAATVSAGAVSMSETLIVALLAGGLFALVRERGGIRAVVALAGKIVKGPATCETATCLLCAAINLFTANNTVAIVVAGPLAAEWRERFAANPKRIAGILDSTSCIVQGLIPYGAQILIAAAIAKPFAPGLDGVDIVLGGIYQPLLAAALAIWIACKARKAK